MALRVAINGFGRIGRMVLRAACNDKGIEIVAINDLTDASTLAHLFKHDSVHGKFPGNVEHTADNLIVNGKSIKINAIRNPAKLPWKAENIDVVLESTGLFTARDKAALHLQAGAGKVIISAPATDEDITIVMGVKVQPGRSTGQKPPVFPRTVVRITWNLRQGDTVSLLQEIQESIIRERTEIGPVNWRKYYV